MNKLYTSLRLAGQHRGLIVSKLDRVYPTHQRKRMEQGTKNRLVGCTANFQEARKKEVIDGLSNEVVKTLGCKLLDVHVTPSINRTNFTFVGSTDAVVKCTMNMARFAFGQIDMRQDPGIHPSIGALDECAFYPVEGVTMEDCIQCSEEFGQKLAENLQIPVYLYGSSAREDKRKRISNIRRRRYKGLKEQLADPEWKPDFGPAKFDPAWGATATGARKTLVAYNVNVLGTEEQCRDITYAVRTSGKPRDDQPGALEAVEGIHWWSPEYDVYQVAMNLVDIDITPVHVVFEKCLEVAREMNVALCGSEVVCLVPLDAILQAANFYIDRENLGNLSESYRVKLAIDRLGLNSVTPFDPQRKIIEYAIAGLGE